MARKKNNSQHRLDTLAVRGYYPSMTNDIEEIRRWLRSRGKYQQIADETGYPYHSLCKFADGRVSEPSYSKMVILINLRDKENQDGNKAA